MSESGSRRVEDAARHVLTCSAKKFNDGMRWKCLFNTNTFTTLDFYALFIVRQSNGSRHLNLFSFTLSQCCVRAGVLARFSATSFRPRDAVEEVMQRLPSKRLTERGITA
jgi:hypothetical protein